MHRNKKSNKTTTIEFWDDLVAEIDLSALARASIPVKGVMYHSPLRFLEIFANRSYQPYSLKRLEGSFLPKIPGVRIRLDETSDHPPFPWRDADPFHLSVSFTYNANALFRILSLLAGRGVIRHQDIDNLLDRACLTLSRIYSAADATPLKHINNNFNMFLISRVIEYLVGKECYDSDNQELLSTNRALEAALSMASENCTLSTMEKMGLAVAKGVAFLEGRMLGRRLEKQAARRVREISHRFFGSVLAIDHRNRLLELIESEGICRGTVSLAVILDDAAESVDDLLWVTDVIGNYSFLKVHLLLNTAQISVNFSSTMLRGVLKAKPFSKLSAELGSRLFVTETYCPFISFQESYLPPHARSLLQNCEIIYVKGANFFETCQLAGKHTFHAFVVYGPVSRAYTGLPDYSGVFAHLPPGTTGFQHNKRREGIITLRSLVVDQ